MDNSLRGAWIYYCFIHLKKIHKCEIIIIHYLSYECSQVFIDRLLTEATAFIITKKYLKKLNKKKFIKLKIIV